MTLGEYAVGWLYYSKQFSVLITVMILRTGLAFTSRVLSFSDHAYT